MLQAPQQKLPVRVEQLPSDTVLPASALYLALFIWTTAQVCFLTAYYIAMILPNGTRDMLERCSMLLCCNISYPQCMAGCLAGHGY